MPNACFNSIKVRLIQAARSNNYNVLQFQFHKGSINTKVQNELGMTVARFQFHKGSINTNSRQYQFEFVKQFQFHKGSINTRW